MLIQNIITCIEKTAPLHFAASWDNSGIQLASPKKTASHIAVMLDSSLVSIQKALDAGADFILAHHPLSMQPQYPNVLNEYFAILSLLIKKEICLYSAHTSLDANSNGPVAWLADTLQLQNCSTLVLATPESTHGFGVVGDVKEPLSFDAFCTTLGKIEQFSAWRSCGPLPKIIRRVACCPGSGASFAPSAAVAGADIFITGDLKYHDALDAPLAIIDVGHFSLEEEMMRRFASMLEQEISLPVTFIPAADPFTFTITANCTCL